MIKQELISESLKLNEADDFELQSTTWDDVNAEKSAGDLKNGIAEDFENGVDIEDSMEDTFNRMSGKFDLYSIINIYEEVGYSKEEVENGMESIGSLLTTNVSRTISNYESFSVTTSDDEEAVREYYEYISNLEGSMTLQDFMDKNNIPSLEELNQNSSETGEFIAYGEYVGSEFAGFSTTFREYEYEGVKFWIFEASTSYTSGVKLEYSTEEEYILEDWNTEPLSYEAYNDERYVIEFIDGSKLELTEGGYVSDIIEGDADSIAGYFQDNKDAISDIIY